METIHIYFSTLGLFAILVIVLFANYTLAKRKSQKAKLAWDSMLKKTFTSINPKEIVYVKNEITHRYEPVEQ